MRFNENLRGHNCCQRDVQACLGSSDNSKVGFSLARLVTGRAADDALAQDGELNQSVEVAREAIDRLARGESVWTKQGKLAIAHSHSTLNLFPKMTVHSVYAGRLQSRRNFIAFVFQQALRSPIP